MSGGVARVRALRRASEARKTTESLQRARWWQRADSCAGDSCRARCSTAHSVYAGYVPPDRNSNTYRCHYDPTTGACALCASWSSLGDGYCDQPCNTSKFSSDGGDCDYMSGCVAEDGQSGVSDKYDTCTRTLMMPTGVAKCERNKAGKFVVSCVHCSAGEEPTRNSTARDPLPCLCKYGTRPPF